MKKIVIPSLIGLAILLALGNQVKLSDLKAKMKQEETKSNHHSYHFHIKMVNPF